MARDGRSGVWQAKFWEHLINSEEDLENHVNYVHYNPVKHGLVDAPANWPWSSFRRWVRAGHYSADWGRTGEEDAAIRTLNRMGKTTGE